MMLRKMMMSTALVLAATTVQAQDLSDARWGEIRTFLEENPRLLEQLETIVDNPGPAEQARADAQAIEENYAALFENPMTPFVGNPDGEVVLVKFSDYACPHCETMNTVLTTLMESDPRIQVRIMEFPVLGEQSQLAARFALAVNKVGGPEAYKIAHDALFGGARGLSERAMRNIAVQAGVDPDAVMEAMVDPEIIAAIQTSLDLAQKLEITGTPGLIVSELIVRGSIPEDAMRSVLQQFYPE